MLSQFGLKEIFVPPLLLSSYSVKQPHNVLQQQSGYFSGVAVQLITLPSLPMQRSRHQCFMSGYFFI